MYGLLKDEGREIEKICRRKQKHMNALAASFSLTSDAVLKTLKASSMADFSRLSSLLFVTSTVLLKKLDSGKGLSFTRPFR